MHVLLSILLKSNVFILFMTLYSIINGEFAFNPLTLESMHDSCDTAEAITHQPHVVVKKAVGHKGREN